MYNQHKIHRLVLGNSLFAFLQMYEVTGVLPLPFSTP